MIINLKINGIEKNIKIKPHSYLLDVLRDLGYKSVKKGCDTGSCGVCTVLLNGKPIRSCSFLAVRAENCEITTIEGVQKQAEEIAKYITAEGADQCGYCSPSLILTIIGMQNEIKNPTYEETLKYVKGNLCRCTGYEGQHRAIRKYLGVE
jgi:carbon-monoxide dehydrogenase small subunit